MSQRSSIFHNPHPPLDVSDFKPAGGKQHRPAPAAIDEISSKGRFQSREPEPAIPGQSIDSPPSTRRQPMTYRTGRNKVFSVKTDPATADEFYAIAQENGWKAAETFEKAVAALRRELAS